MKTFALVLIILGIVAVICFAVAFFLELAKTNEKENSDVETKNEDNTTNEQVAETTTEPEKEEDFDLDAMLAKLEASAATNANEENAETEQEEQSVKTEQEETNEEVSANGEEETNEVVEEAKAEEINENQEENGDEVNDVVEENNEVVEAEENREENTESSSEETTEQEIEQPQEENTETENENSQVIVDSEPVETDMEVSDADDNTKGKVIVVREHTHEVINNGNSVEEVAQPTQEVVDLSTRLASVREAQDKVDADLVKVNRDINKYERTERRMARNQKLLDKKAEDLTKLNLVLYSVTDIKNIDADKKQKQEELVTHINELKSSIKDAESYLDTNKEKYENAQKMKAFFEGEKARLNDDEKEILTLMGQNTDN